jgi:hypothetical protein
LSKGVRKRARLQRCRPRVFVEERPFRAAIGLRKIIGL